VRREGKFHFLTIRPGVLQAVAAVLAALGKRPLRTPLTPTF
jgi:hypothetical protein